MIFENYKKALVVGAGSGGDILTSILIVNKLTENKITVDLAGFLTPWSLHSFNDQLEITVNKLDSKKPRKFLVNEKNNDIDFFEPLLFQLSKDQYLNVKNIYLLSLQYGIDKLRSDVIDIIKQNEYDLVVVVDVGGDILARSEDLPYIFTPIVDKSCLEIFGSIKNTKSILAVVSPGVDGELSEKTLKEILSIYKKDNNILIEEKILSSDQNYKSFFDVLNYVRQRSNFAGNTIKVIDKILSRRSTYQEQFVKKIILGDKTWDIKFPVTIDPVLSQKIYYFDLNNVKINTNLRIKYSSITEAYHLFKKMGAGGTEVDLKYVPNKIYDGKYREVNFILNVINRATDIQKRDIINYVKNSIDFKEGINIVT